MTEENKIPESNIIKTRDDHCPISFKTTDQDDTFEIINKAECSWANNNIIHKSDLRQRIEPWLCSLFQSEHLALLIGSGLTHAIHEITTGNPATSLDQVKFTVYNEEIINYSKKSAEKAGRNKGNFEDQIRVANELLVGLGILCLPKDPDISLPNDINIIFANSLKLRDDIKNNLHAFAHSVLTSEANIANAEDNNRTKAFNILVNFLMSFASRTGTRDRLQIYTTNYDRLIEAGAEIAGMHLIDRFVGNLMPIFRSSRLDIDMHYNPPGIRGEPRYLEGVARYTKLHGSVDWVQTGKDIRRIGLPFGAESIDSFLKAPISSKSSSYNLMIYPNSSKDRETTEYPYVELFRDFAAGICRPNTTLVTFGYSFGDEHINRAIEDMMTIPSTHLVIISYSDPLKRIMKTYDKLGRPSQISLLIGDHLGNLEILVDNYLPKSAIDRTTIRMSEILRSRFGSQEDNLNSKTSPEINNLSPKRLEPEEVEVKK